MGEVDGRERLRLLDGRFPEVEGLVRGLVDGLEGGEILLSLLLELADEGLPLLHDLLDFVEKGGVLPAELLNLVPQRLC